ncbi:MAG: efflux RND transporter permease subunit [Aureliella sp.]
MLCTTVIGCGGIPDKPKNEATSGALPTGAVEAGGNVARPEFTFQIRQHPEWNRGDAVLVRLDIDRLRAYDLSKEDLMEAMEGMTGSNMGPKEPRSLPGVVFNSHLYRPEQYEEIILKENADGEIVRVKDVAMVELLADHEEQVYEPSSATDGGGK